MGAEIDLSARTSAIDGVNVVGGGAAFFPAKDFAGPDADPEFWGYLQLVVRR